VLWGYVIIYVNPENTIEVNVPVEFINESSLTSRSLVMVSDRDVTVPVRFTGRIQSTTLINKDTVKATVNLRDARAGVIPMSFSLQGAEVRNVDYTPADPLNPFVIVEIDRIVSMYVPISFEFIGEVTEGFEIDPAILNPGQIYITGPAGVLAEIDIAVAQFEPHEPIYRTIDNWLITYVLHNKDGHPVESEYITADYIDVALTLPVRMVKTVSLRPTFTEGGGLTEKNIVVSTDPVSVRISGDPELLEGINNIPITHINLAALLESSTQTYVIPYPDNVRNLEHIDEANLTITIVDAAARDIITSNVSVKGLPDGYSFTVAGTVTVTVRGSADAVDRVQPHNVRLVADLTDIDVTSAVRHRRSAEVFIDGVEGVGAVEKGYEVILDITRDAAGGES
jgi:YbbR domain-containing protein